MEIRAEGPVESPRSKDPLDLNEETEPKGLKSTVLGYTGEQDAKLRTQFRSPDARALPI